MVAPAPPARRNRTARPDGGVFSHQDGLFNVVATTTGDVSASQTPTVRNRFRYGDDGLRTTLTAAGTETSNDGCVLHG